MAAEPDGQGLCGGSMMLPNLYRSNEGIEAERDEERDGMSDDEGATWFVWGEGTVFHQPGGNGMLLNGHASPQMERLFASIAALDPGWTPPPFSEPDHEVWWGDPVVVDGPWVIFTGGTEREIRAYVDRYEDVRGMLRVSSVPWSSGSAHDRPDKS
ncbi:hypothetical protein ACIQFZ_40170 [Streptomyces sp. NPDC093064]|uniref:hypothetical protein n=1 Tax=Streptomyces sp. NPDC093064 TaxID=3366020 RepID=UPI00380C5ADF